MSSARCVRSSDGSIVKWSKGDGVLVKSWRVFLLLAFHGHVWAVSSPLTLTEAVEQAKRYNPTKAVLTAQRQALLARQYRAQAPDPPTAQLSRSFGGTGEFEVSQSLGHLWKAPPRAKGLELEARRIDFELQAEDLEVTKKVKQVFNALGIVKNKRKVNDVRRSTFENILSVARRRLVKGTTTEVEWLRVQAEVAAVNNESTDLLAMERAARATLSLLLGRSPEEVLEIQDALMPTLPIPLKKEDLKKAFLAMNPSLRAAQAGVEVGQQGVRVAQSHLLPDLLVGGGVDTAAQAKLGVGVSLPFWSWLEGGKEVEAAEHEEEALRARVQAVTLALSQQVEEHLARLEAIGQKMMAYDTTIIPLANQAFQLALPNYGFGKVDYNTLAGAANAWVDAKMNYETLVERYLLDITELEAVVGGPLP